MTETNESNVSERKLEANRENSKKSTGPRTPRDKAIASLNALTHGVFAKRAVAYGPPLIEEPGEYLEILEGLRAHCDPVGVHEDLLVQEIAGVKWKALRFARWEEAGVAARLSAAREALRKDVEAQTLTAWQQGVQLGSLGDPEERAHVTAKQLRAQIDLVDALESGSVKEEDVPEFWVFVWDEKNGKGAGEPQPESTAPDTFRNYLASLPPADLENLKSRFRKQAQDILHGMWVARPKTVQFEVAIERSLVPDEAELNLSIRYSNSLLHCEERKVAMLERFQAMRRKKSARNG